MRLSNRSKTPLYNFINTSLLMLILIGLIGFLLGKNIFGTLGGLSYLLVVIPLFVFALYYLAGKHIFEYDSDGLVLHFRNRNIVPFLSKEVNDEFPKYKMLSYEIVNFFLIRRLYIKISSKNSGSAVLKYEISYLTNKEVNDLKLSLNKVVKANKESIH
ncbi:hypothetical protein CHRY9390_02688 [Chryseobacterium aquaeductus]|uniref:Uncharacterized protein n=1 Tax=Chryseobacterium aquaeductus TaxID=2675056 RepID=A0A9N8MIA2_9FLAO|nr:hypothetical protein [Chryseobacterium aquaeductus]CAA7331970.1 hypothetical protein CHRY9390_02688 [Chryseobacterium potabilaquae]CAD7813655.1 hypothetical protein CHRY9390_02688 [Chryseobacterium aquaeductus]